MFVNNINPILFQYYFIQIRWYGILLALGVLLAIFLMTKLFKENNFKKDLALDLGIWLTVGGLIGARLGEILFYEPAYYFSHPLEMIMVNHGGLSSHGMTIGLLITFFLFVKIKKIAWQTILDLTIIAIPVLAGFIRLGNFTNSEIVGRTTNLPWGIYFPRYELEPILRHPSQIYEALLAFSLFFILYSLFKKYSQKLPPLFITHLFLFLYFSSRFMIEFVKEFPTYFGLTIGQWLSVPFILWGMWWFINLKIKKSV